MKANKFLAFLLTGALAAAAVSCGDSDSGDDPSEARSSTAPGYALNDAEPSSEAEPDDDEEEPSSKASAKGDYKSASAASEAYLDSVTKEDMGELYHTLTIPNDRITELKNDGTWKERVDYFNALSRRTASAYSIKVVDSKQGEPLNAACLAGAENLFSAKGASEQTALEGWEYKAELETTEKSSGETETSVSEYCVVRFEKDGYKIFESDAAFLKKYGELSGEAKPAD